MSELTVQSVSNEIRTVSEQIIQKDFSTVRGFAERQLEGLAQYALAIQKGVANGNIDDDLKQFFYDGLEATTANFVNTLKGLLIVTLEKLLNAITDILWKVVNTAVGTAI